MIAPDDRELLQTYLDGSLPSDQAELVVARLKAEPELALAYVALAREEAVCRRWADLAAVDEPEPLLPLTRNGRQTQAPAVVTIPPRRGGLAPLGAAAAILLVVGASVLYFVRPPAEVVVSIPDPPTVPRPSAPVPAAIAQLAQASGSVYLGDPETVRVHAGESIRGGQTIRVGPEGSAAVIRFDDGTSLELGPYTRISLNEVDGGKRVFLTSGVLTADVKKQTAPMIVATPHAEIKVLGTRFCSISGELATQVELEEGKIELTRKSDGQTVEVRQGTFATASAKGEHLTPLPLPRKITREERRLHVGEGPVLSLATSPDNQLVAAGGWHGTVNIWNLSDGEGHRMLGGHAKKVRALVFTPDSQRLISAAEDGQIRIWKLSDGSVEHILTGHRDQKALAVSPDGTLLASGGWSRGAYSILLTDLRTMKPVAVLGAHRNSVSSLAFSPDGQVLASGGRDGQVKLWHMAQHVEIASLACTGQVVDSVTFAPDGTLLAAGTNDGAIQLWDWRAQEVRHSWQSRTGPVACVRFSPDGRILASSGGRGSTTLWDLTDLSEGPTIGGHHYMIPAISFSADGKTLATAGWDAAVKLWNLGGANLQ